MHSCTGPLPNKCTPESGFNGCWWDATTKVTACRDMFDAYRQAAALGTLKEGDSWTQCQ